MSDILQLAQCDIYTLMAEKTAGKWWLELIERASGLTWIIYCDTKGIAARTFKGMTNQEARAWMDRLGVQPVQMYKKGVM